MGKKLPSWKNKVTEMFGQVRDPRVVERCDHKLVDILFIAFCTLLSNGEDFEDMVEFANQREDWLNGDRITEWNTFT